jgi:acylphosphatase
MGITIMVRAKAIVNGVVQGVGFRFFASRLASRYGVTGYAKNLPTGEVVIEAEGEKSVVSGFLEEIKIGPRHAHISDMRVEWLEPKNYKVFSTY